VLCMVLSVSVVWCVFGCWWGGVWGGELVKVA